MIDTAETFLRLVRILRELESTTSRTKKIQILSSFLRELAPVEISPIILLISGSIFPEGDERVLEVSGKTLQKILSSSKQTALEKSPLTMINVYDQLQRVASISGKGSRSKREAILSSLISQASEDEAKYITRILLGELRIGLAKGLILEAISQASKVDVNLTKRTYTLTGDLGKTAKIALTEHEKGLRRIGVRLFEPIKPMLADTAPDLETALKTHHGKTALEYKLDGARVQIHKQDEHIEVFSRRLSNITSSLPEVVELIRSDTKAQEAILEGEVVAVDQNGRPMPFQELMRRFRRTSDVQEAMNKVSTRLFLFDLLYLKGALLLDLPEHERRRLLERACSPELLTPRHVTEDMNEAKDYFNRAIEEGHEGLVAKSPDSKYMPGTRGKEWLKIKRAETLDAVVVAADWGSGRRYRWLSNYHLAVRDARTNRFLDIGKTFKGLTDEEFEYMTARLNNLKTSEDDFTVRVRPELVVEVAYDEVQKSPHYNSGYALRFARITRIREDKSPNDADTLEKVQEVYEAQFKRKAKPK